MNGTPLQKIVKSTINDLTKARTKKQCNDIWKDRLSSLITCRNTKGKIISDYTIRRAVHDIRSGIENRLDKSKPTHLKRLNWLLHDQQTGLDGIKKHALGIVVSGKDIASRNEKHKKVKMLQKAEIKRPIYRHNEMIKTCEILLKSYNWKEVALAMCLLTGRRTIEVLKTGNFKPLKGKYMLFSGQAKTKKQASFVIPVLTSPSKISKAVKHLRELKNFQKHHKQDVNKIANMPLKRACVKHLKGFISKDATTHDLRRVYTRICVDKILPENQMILDENGGVVANERLFIQYILGHEKTSTGLLYENWEIL